MKATNKLTQQRIATFNALAAISAMSYAPAAAAGDGHGRVAAFNASLAVESSFSQPLTQYATGFSETSDLDAALEFFAPEVPVAPRFEYAVFSSDEAFLSETDDKRAINADFKDVSYTSEKVDAHTDNHGLQITLDYDQVRDMPNWEEYYTRLLMDRVKRNSLRRAIALLSAAAVNTAKTWDVSAGKDPDQDVILDLITAAGLSGIMPNRVGYGDTAWAKRALAHRAQNTAGGFASASLTADALAALLGVESVLRSSSRYTSGVGAKTEVLANIVLGFNAQSGVSTEDPSNIKRFVSNGNSDEGGGRWQVYSQRISAKRHVIAVGNYEATKITSLAGIRKFTIS